MKIITILLVLGSLIRGIIMMPVATLPQYPVLGTEPQIRKAHKEQSPSELRYMSQKMYYLKTGRRINSEKNYRKQQNYWGPGFPSNVRFPSHLAMWEETRRAG